MNSTQAKQIALTQIMSLLGHDVMVREMAGQELKYFSPFRIEKTPSFNVNLPKNAWFDFGLNKGGNSLDLAITYVEHHGIGFGVSDALKWLDGLVKHRGGGVKMKRAKPIIEAEAESKLELLKVSEVKNNLIRSYLTDERKIEPRLIDLYLKEIRYKNLDKDKTYFAYGMENLSGGYEVRVASDKYPFKSAINGRDISVIGGARPGSKMLNIFEGTTDFLSLLTMMKTEKLTGDSLIMHSLSSYNRALKYIEENDYQSINLFLDNDKTGKHHTAAFIRDLGSDKVTNQANLFSPHKDINEALKAQFTPAILRR